MAFKETSQVGGLTELLDRIRVLKRGAKNQIVRPMVTAGAQVILWAARANLRRHGFKSASLLYKSLGTKIKVYLRSGVVVGMVGPRTGYKTTKGKDGIRRRLRTALGEKYQAAGQDPSKIAHLVEGGRRDVRPVKKKVMASAGEVFGTHARAVGARPFLRPALDENQEQVRSAMAEVGTKKLEALAQKGG